MIVFGLVTGGYFILTKNVDENKNVAQITPTITENSNEPLKAAFGIFTNSTFRIFSDPRYLNQSDEVFMDEASVVTVKKEGITWNDFFKTLPMELTKDCLTTGTGQVFCSSNDEKLRFFVNGKEDPEALNKIIKEDDRLLVSFGNKSDDEIKNEIDTVSNL